MSVILKNININNFKSIKSASMHDCNTINIIVGKPNAGKSNFLEAISLYEVYNSENKSLKDFVRLNRAEDVFHFNQIENDIEVDINDFKLNYKNYINTKGSLVYINNNKIQNSFSLLSNLNDIDNFKSYDNYYNNDSEIFKIRRVIFDKYRLNDYNITNELNFPYCNNLFGYINAHKDIAKELIPLLDIEALRFLFKSDGLEFIKEADGLLFSLKPNQLADTLLSLIFYITIIKSQKDKVLLLEEPEAHTFEPYLLEFTNAIKYDQNENQYFIVTHNLFLINEFLRDEIGRNKTNIYLIKNVDNANSSAKRLDFDKNQDVISGYEDIFYNFDDIWDRN